MTPKQIVLQRFPEAHSYDWSGPSFVIYPGNVEIRRGKRKPWPINNGINIGEPTARQAWAAAAKKLRRYPYG